MKRNDEDGVNMGKRQHAHVHWCGRPDLEDHAMFGVRKIDHHHRLEITWMVKFLLTWTGCELTEPIRNNI